MLAVSCVRIAAVHRFITLRRQEFRLRLLRPVGKAPRLLAVESAHFLQANQVGIELLDGMPDVVDL